MNASLHDAVLAELEKFEASNDQGLILVQQPNGAEIVFKVGRYAHNAREWSWCAVRTFLEEIGESLVIARRRFQIPPPVEGRSQ